MIKTLLLELGVFNDNAYLDKYCNLILDNLTTKKKKFITQKHHIIPQCYYKINELQVDNSDENIVNLEYKFHLLAHYYLCLCCKNNNLYYRLLTAFTMLANQINKQNTKTNVDLDEQFIIDYLDKAQFLYEEYKRALSEDREGKRTWNKGLTSIYTEDQLEKIRINTSKSLKKYFASLTPEERREKMHRDFSEETRHKLSIAHSGENNAFYGKKHTDEAKQKMSYKVICIETGEVFESVGAACKWCGSGHVGSVCRGERERAGGYHWEYYDKTRPLKKVKNKK